MIAEPVASVTDYAITLECFLFARLLFPLSWKERCWAAAFASVGVAALLGGTYHGFADSLSATDLHLVWQGTLVALAIASFWMLLAAAWRIRRRWAWVALATIKLMLLLSLTAKIWAFVACAVDYFSTLGIALLLMERSLPNHSHRQPRSGAGPGWMVAGIVISGVAACCLIIPWPAALKLSPVAAYHLIQMVALYCIYRSVRAIAQLYAMTSTQAKHKTS